MSKFVSVVLQVFVALLVSALLAPVLLATVSPARDSGPIALAILVGIVFVVTRVLWRRPVHRE